MVKKTKLNLLVVGGTGFIGYHVILAAKKKGLNITSLSIHRPKKKRYVKNVKYITANIANFEELKKKVKTNFNYVVNLGGYGRHDDFAKGGGEIFKNHFLGVVNLTKIFSKKKIKKFIQIGSSEEYGKTKAPQSENLEGYPTSPYALAKLASTKYLQILYKKEKFPSTILRLFLVYGPHQDENRALPQIIKGCLKNKKFPTTKGNQIRDFCYIDDVVDAIFLTMFSKTSNGEIINIGSGETFKIKNVIEKVRQIIGKGKPQYGKMSLRKNENINLYPKIEKAKIKIKWYPKIKFDQGIRIVLRSMSKKYL